VKTTVTNAKALVMRTARRLTAAIPPWPRKTPPKATGHHGLDPGQVLTVARQQRATAEAAARADGPRLLQRAQAIAAALDRLADAVEATR
jgi:hypothetical protein